MSPYPKPLEATLPIPDGAPDAVAPEPHLRLVTDPQAHIEAPQRDRPPAKPTLLPQSLPDWGTEPIEARTSQPLSWEAGMVAQRAADASEESAAAPRPTATERVEQKDALDRLGIAQPIRWLAVMATTATMGIGGSVGLSQQLQEADKAPTAIAAEPASPSQGQDQGYK